MIGECAFGALRKARLEIGGRSDGGKLVPGPAALSNAMPQACPSRAIGPAGKSASIAAQDPATQQPSGPQQGMCLMGDFVVPIS